MFYKSVRYLHVGVFCFLFQVQYFVLHVSTCYFSMKLQLYVMYSKSSDEPDVLVNKLP